MANMKYCRFHNTLMDLQDCYAAAHEYDDGTLSDAERTAFETLVKLCRNFANDYADDFGEDYDED